MFMPPPIFPTDPNMYIADSGNGSYSITTENGITVTVTPENPLPDGIRLVVYVVPVTEAEAYKWFSDCTKDIGENILPFDIYFFDLDYNMKCNKK